MNDPVNVKTCLHKFCSKCINDYIRIEKKECPTCRNTIGSRRILRKDDKLAEIISKLIPDLESYREYEQEEIKRNIKVLSSSKDHKAKLDEIRKIRERQIRNEQEERKEQKIQRPKVLSNRRPEPKPREIIPRERSPLNDKRFRQIKRPKTEDRHPINIKFKLKQIAAFTGVSIVPKPSERIIQKLILETNDQLCLKQINQFIKLKATNPNLNMNSVSYFVRSRSSKNRFDKITSYETSLKDLKNAYWANEKSQTLYFMCS